MIHRFKSQLPIPFDVAEAFGTKGRASVSRTRTTTGRTQWR